MSVPARIADPLVQPSPTPVRPPRTTAARPPRTSPPHLHRRARRGSPFAFWILVAVVAATLIIGIASLSALLVEASFQVDDLQGRLGAMQQQHEVLREQVAADSSPERVMAWASERGMQMPEQVVIVRLAERRGDAG